ncbi:imm11 family protein [Archangium sp.]|uniref:imm11 family protein n=1 Tax=Archangium sp. TaxID=1872627 RepID=UPI003899D574
MPRHEYFIFVINSDPRVGTIKNLDDAFADYWMLNEGMALQGKYPPKLELALSNKSGDMVTDFIDNIHKVVLVSEKARAILEQAGLGPELVEFLPFTLKDRKRKKVAEPYFIANALQSFDCFDWDRSKYNLYPNKRKVVSTSLSKLYVLEDKVPKDALFFRLGELKNRILIRSDLLETLKAAGCTGISVAAMGEPLP